jgi:hypothetical protein
MNAALSIFIKPPDRTLQLVLRGGTIVGGSGSISAPLS